MRYEALSQLFNRKPVSFEEDESNLAKSFGENVFGINEMRNHLSKDVFKSIENTIKTGQSIDRKIADHIAIAMKDWAVTKGATHYTHWFQPLTGSTAEKHDAFFEPTSDGRAIQNFSGSMLAQQEPDASSFPNGGIRNTFEARGYTAWDPTSPAFVIGKTLCIPTIFISYTGEALDNKLPLLKALNALDKAATSVAQFFDRNITKVNATLGWEQEYFLVDTALFNARPDLMMTGRALVGHISAKGQQLDDHYFGTIPDRVSAFMRDFEQQSLKLGIPVKTRHNEVAPNQFECAPVFEEANLAIDHNLLLMDLLEKVASKHNFKVLLHEKPFHQLNGSGKHNNWSMSTDTGVNLLAPGNNPKTNLRFLTFFVNTIKAIHDYPDILRASIASASNDHRLGANEAPPAIISVFIGQKLTEILDKLEKNIKNKAMSAEEKTALKLDIGKIPELLIDNTDRNRTSPFAFTGNKFEFRAVGSTANCAVAMLSLNTIVAKQLNTFKEAVDKRIEKGEKKDIALLKEIQKLIKSSKNIRFEGNGYGEEWVEEATKRGLSNLKDTPRALATYKNPQTKKLFVEMGVFNEVELEARHEIELENYTLKLQIEGRVLEELCHNYILPAAVEYQNQILENITGLNNTFGQGNSHIDYPKSIAAELSHHIKSIYDLVTKMNDARKKANKIETSEEKAFAYCDTVKPYFDQIRYHSNKIERTIDNKLWPLPKLRELLFTK